MAGATAVEGNGTKVAGAGPEDRFGYPSYRMAQLRAVEGQRVCVSSFGMRYIGTLRIDGRRLVIDDGTTWAPALNIGQVRGLVVL